MALNYDSEALRRILRDLTCDDPEFVRSFEAEEWPQPSPPDEHTNNSLIWKSVSITTAVLTLALLALGSLSSAMLLAAVTWFAADRGFRSTGNKQKRGPG